MRRFVVAIALLAACGDDDSGSGSLTPDGLAGAYINAVCGTFVQCGLITDVSTCRGLDLDFEIDPELLAAIDNGTVLFNESEARQCLASLGGTCEDFEPESDNEHCELVFTGTVPGGGACGISAQCISQQCQFMNCPVDGCCTGMCVGDTAPVPTRLGDSCASSSCDAGYCDDVTLVCTAPKPTGSTCTDDDECAVGICDGVCTELPGAGEPCVGSSESRACNSIGLYCGAAGTCEPYALEGETCNQTTVCSPVYQCLAGACELRPTLGDTCQPNTSLDCIDKSWCDPATMRCTAPKPDGATCQESDECTGDCDFDTMTCMTDPICV